MLTLLALFGLVAVLVPTLSRGLGTRVFFVAAAVPAASFVHAILQAPQVLTGHVPTQAYDWIPQFGIRIALRMDVLGWVMTLIVTGVGALVLLYCRWYFDGQTEGIGRFGAVLLAFAGAMYGLVLTDDIIVLVMLWEVTSILSYLLIGFYHRRAASRRAALQALLVTTLGGLALFVGAIMLTVDAGTTSLAHIIADPPTGPAAVTAVALLLVGAVSKSALFPFHFWLPAAMAAPTPVSAYLHAAAMVKAGVYLVARLAPAFALTGPWRPMLLTLGILTMLMGGIQALRETDLKRLLAAGTVSQLAFITILVGYGVRDVALAGLAILCAHALFKSALFLVVGIIDRQLSTRDIRELHGLGRRAPVLAGAATAAALSMAGVIPTLGFAGKEAAFTGLLHEAQAGSALAVVVLVAVVLGATLTVAYSIRFVWGAFARKRDAAGRPVPDTSWPGTPAGLAAAPVILAAAGVVAGFAAGPIGHVLGMYASTLPAASPGLAASDPYHLALWHGLVPALGLSVLAWLAGAGLFAAAHAAGWDRRRHLLPFSAGDAYNGVLHGISRAAVGVTARVQNGSLPGYVGVVVVVFIAAVGTALVAGIPHGGWMPLLDAAQTPWQAPAALVMIVAGLLAVRARKRYTGVVLVSVTGLGMVVLYATSGAPDLALTQVLVETVTMVAFALVLRGLPSRLGEHHPSVRRVARAVIAGAAGVVIAAAAVVAASARQAARVSMAFPDLAYELGHGKNVVNVTLVDLRGWDTMGELSVLVLAATGVASLVFLTHRTDALSGLRALPADVGHSRRLLVETPEGLRRAQGTAAGPRAWLVGGRRVHPRERSIMLEVIVRILFPTVIVISLYLLLAGHNLPGGGFAAGLVAGMALVMRYVAGGRFELGAAAPARAGMLLGTGMILATGAAAVPVFFGGAPLRSGVLEVTLPLVGHLEIVSSTVFDVGVYLVVVGLVLDVLRSLGAEIDRKTAERSAASRAGAAGEGAS